ncbi:hypothetical protein Tco_0851781 [Tanacetum coccineum]
MMKADRLLAERLQTREREELTDEEKGKLFMELMEKRRKHFAELRAQEKINRHPTRAQKRTQMYTYLKHMGGYKHKQLMGKSYDEIQKLFDKEMKRDDDIAIDVIPLATKPPVIVEYKLLKEGIMMLVKTKHGDIRPEDDHERVMWGDFKVMFELDIRSKVWRDLQEDEAKEEGNVKTSTSEYEDHEMAVESEEEFKEKTKKEIEEEEDSPKHFDTFPTMKELRYHEWLLKNPQTPWVKAKVGATKETIKPWENLQFCGESQGAKVFVGNFTYECDFMVLEDTTSVIDHDLGAIRSLIAMKAKRNKGEVMLGRVTSSPATRLINKEKRFLGGNSMFIFPAY